MKCLVVLAHPQPASLNAHLADRVAQRLRRAGHDVVLRDLYAEGFDPVLTPRERAQYYAEPFEDKAGLGDVDGLVLVFPTWWFAPPAILKGWIDRTFLPGIAYTHAPGGAALVPHLTGLRAVMAVTTLGAAGWVDWLILRRPVAQMLRWGVVRACAPQARFSMLSLYRSEQLDASRLTRFETRLERRIDRLFGEAG